jgi:hypothetical protein
MIINSSSISFSSQHKLLEEYSLKESLNIHLSENPKQTNQKDTVNLSSKAKNTDDEDEVPLTPELKMIKMLLERMIGMTIKFVKIDGEESNDQKGVEKKQPEQDNQPSIEYKRSESYRQSEETGFYAKGAITTTEGKSINFAVKLNLSREFISTKSISIGNQKAKDPLVINLNGNSVQLTETKFKFDIDADGEIDQVSFVDSNSGFLAIDRNNDGKINDGSELFGPKTGDGFAELKSYDYDHNNWIDEKDPIYAELRIWSKDDNGNDVISNLKQKEIGAIYLCKSDTQFDINDKQNNTQGILKSSGIYVSESGSVGTVQQVDLVV